MLVLPLVVFVSTVLFDLSSAWRALGIKRIQALVAQSLTLFASVATLPWPRLTWILALTPLLFFAPKVIFVRDKEHGLPIVFHFLLAIFTIDILESKMGRAYPYERLLGVDFGLWMSIGWAFAALMLVRRQSDQLIVLCGSYLVFQLSSLHLSHQVSYEAVHRFWTALLIIFSVQIMKFAKFRFSNSASRWI